MADIYRPDLVGRALELLGKRKLVLSIHDGSFPGDSDEDLGRGTPYSRGGKRFVQFLRALGFNGLQLGPQGQTGPGNPSPYDGTAFSRNILSIALRPLAQDPEWGGLLSQEELTGEIRRLPAGGEPGRVRYQAAYEAQMRLLERAFGRYEERQARGGDSLAARAGGVAGAAAGGVADELAAFCERNCNWLEPESLYEALVEEHGSEDWRQWPERGAGRFDRRLFQPAPAEEDRCRRRRSELRRLHERRIDFFVFCQFLAHRQHLQLHGASRRQGLDLFADLQIGLSIRDAWTLGSLFLAGYALGAPPSRTNPSGQPWGYPVFDPAGYRSWGGRSPEGTLAGQVGEGPVVEVLRRRIEKLFAEYDGLRIDHPQGLVCPWVYRTDDPDPLHAVQNGGRLFASPSLPDHPRLAAYAIARPDQLATDPEVRRHDDGWVRDLDQGQVQRYALLMDVIVEAARGRSRDGRNIACEILSTLPYPLQRVLRLYNLGRFRVTQKADLRDREDVYRSENAEAQDWIMMGTHDTPPIWRVAEAWFRTGEARERAAYLARRLAPGGQVEAYRAEFARDPHRLVHAQLADALASRAEQVVVFFADLFGFQEPYNTPGSVGPENWSLRVPEDYQSAYPEGAARLEALNLPYALALALGSPAGGSAAVHATLIAALEAAAGMAARGSRPSYRR